MKLLAGPYLAQLWANAVLRRRVLLCVALVVTAAVAEIAVALSLVPILSSLGVDAGRELGGLVEEEVPPAAWLLLFAAAAALRSLVNWLSAVQSARASQDLVVTLQGRLYRALAKAHWDTVRRLSPPRLADALHTQSYRAGFSFVYFVQVAAAGILLLGYGLSAAAVFPQLLPVLLLMVALVWRLNRGRGYRVRDMGEEYRSAQAGLHKRYEDWVAINRIVPLGVDAEHLANRFEAEARDAASHAVGFGRSAAGTRVSYELAVVGGVLAGVPIAWWLETPPALLVFGLVLFVRVFPQAGAMHVGYQHLVSAVAPVRALDTLAAELERDPIAQGRLQPVDLDWQRLELVNVGVREGEDAGRWILRDVDLVLRRGEWLALTGPTGAGKTTLAEVMLGLVRPDAGTLRLDENIINDALADRWRAQCAYVPQDVVLIDASIRENLLLYLPEAGDAALEAVLERAAADFVISQLPEGLDTRVGPGGRWLSGGERQRIGIARALLREPAFLVLDEPTAALDAGTQAALMNKLAALRGDMSVVLITHRPELLALADRTMVLDGGRVIGDGVSADNGRKGTIYNDSA